MSDDTQNEGRESSDDTDGIRIIGAEEAAARRAEQSDPGAKPLRFGLPENDDTGVLPHWTDPPTGEVPRLLFDDAEEADQDVDSWSSFASAAPRWRDSGSDWADDDSMAELGDDDTRIGALIDDHSDPFSIPEPEVRHTGESPVTPIRTRAPRGGGRAAPARAGAGGTPRPSPAVASGPAAGAGRGGRNMPVAVGVGVAVAAAFLVACKVFDTTGAIVVVTLVIGAASGEFYGAVRKVGYHPATLLGITATVSLVLGAYWRGEAAIPLVSFLTVVAGLLWFLFGGFEERPVPNVAITLTGFGYVGILGCFAALLLKSTDGVGLLLVAVIGTVAYDVAGLFVGSSAGRSRLAPAISPNKTWEGLVGGMVVSFAAVVITALNLAPWSDGGFADAVKIALAIAIMAPLGDLAESMIKRDLNIKDMGTILPGHGGLLDRFDALLFVLPTTYYMARLIFS